jgi:Protein of unknown function (DUF3800)
MPATGMVAMKFAYVDESGGRDQSDVFVMVGLLEDAYRLRKTTMDFDQLLKALFDRHPGHPAELKTRAFINGRGNWNVIPGEERKQLLRDICAFAADGNKLFAVAMSFDKFDEAKGAGFGQPTGDSYWLAAGMFVSALIQKRMQSVAGRKGLTVLVMDDNEHEMPHLSDGLYNADPWFDGLYQVRGRRRGIPVWLPRTASDRFNQIINTAFAIKSEHSSLIQVADALAYVYRRKIELQTQAEAYPGERAYFDELYDMIEPRREKMGHSSECNAVGFYRAAVPDGWAL